MGLDTCDQPDVNSLEARTALWKLLSSACMRLMHTSYIRNTPVRRPPKPALVESLCFQTSMALANKNAKVVPLVVIAVIAVIRIITGHCVFVWFSVRKLANKNYQ